LPRSPKRPSPATNGRIARLVEVVGASPSGPEERLDRVLAALQDRHFSLFIDLHSSVALDTGLDSKAELVFAVLAGDPWTCNETLGRTTSARRRGTGSRSWPDRSY
jgi:hypothetical protein